MIPKHDLDGREFENVIIFRDNKNPIEFWGSKLYTYDPFPMQYIIYGVESSETEIKYLVNRVRNIMNNYKSEIFTFNTAIEVFNYSKEYVPEPNITNLGFLLGVIETEKIV